MLSPKNTKAIEETMLGATPCRCTADVVDKPIHLALQTFLQYAKRRLTMSGVIDTAFSPFLMNLNRYVGGLR